MPNIKQSKKRAQQQTEQRVRNRSLRSELRTHIKRVYRAVAKGDVESARSAYQSAVPIIDRVASKGVIHANKAARHKRRLNAHVRAVQGQA